LLLTALFLSTSLFALSAADNHAAEAIAKLIAELDDNDFSNRERATRELIQVGEPAVKPLAEAAQSGSLETTIRSINILQAIYKSDVGSAVDAAILAFEQLSQSTNRSVAARAELVLIVHSEVRHGRAEAAIKELGGIFRDPQKRRGRAIVMPPARPGPPVRRIGPVDVLVLSEAWKGGDAGLIHLKRLTTLRSLVVTEGSGITQKGLDELTGTFPQLFIQPRGRACLGIEGGRSLPNGLAVSRVTPGSAADKAGLLSGDVITTFNGRPMADDERAAEQAFEKLIECIKATKPGDKISVDVLRKNESVTLEVIMGRWAL
jgi:hypothetical protein